MKRLMQTAAAAAMVCMLAAPALAATQWNFSGSLQYKTFWNQRDYGDFKGEDLEGGGALVKSDGKLDWTTQGDSYVAMEMVSDHLEGYIEMQWDYDANKVVTNYYWGKYNFNEDFSILIGQTDPLFIQEISNQVIWDNANLNGIGTANSDTLPMIALAYKGFTFAMAKPVNNTDYDVSSLVHDRDTFMPQLQASYAYEADEWRVKFAGAYANSRVKWQGANSETLHSWLLGMDGQVFFGPLSLGAAVSYGQNWDAVGWNDFDGWGWGYPVVKINSTSTSFDFEDTDSLMLALVAGYQLTEDLYFEGGAGYRRDDNDEWHKAHTSWNLYGQAVYTIAPGFSIIPEVGYINYGKNVDRSKDKFGYEWYAGAQWRLDF